MSPPAPVRVLVAADKFKGSLSAAGVAAAVGAGIHRRHGAEVVVEAVPVADGGDGTLEAMLAAGYERCAVPATGPTGEPVEAAYARKGDTAVVELASICGLVLLPGGVPAPLTATSYGLGQVVAAALDAGCTELVIGIGGSASTDGGSGLLAALGARVQDGNGLDLPPGGAALADASRLDVTGLHPGLARARVVVACDVDNPLTGPAGAAAIYGPQKGATAEDIAVLDAALGHWAEIVAATVGADRADEPGAGAAGGVGFAVLSVLGAQARPGIELVLELVDFDRRLRGAGLVVTGEGSLDGQTLRGKAAAGVAAAAARAGVPTVAVAGRVQLAAEDLDAAGISAAYALSALESDPAVSMREAARLIEEIAVLIAAEWIAE